MLKFGCCLPPSIKSSVYVPGWHRIWSAGVDSGRILRFSFGPGVKNFGKKRIRSHFSISAKAGVCVVMSQVKTWVDYVKSMIVAGV